jgi:hypothetical protein
MALVQHSAQDAVERTWREAVWVDVTLAEAALVRLISHTSSLAHETDPPDHRPMKLHVRVCLLRRGDQRARAHLHRRGERGCLLICTAAPVLQPDVRCASRVVERAAVG